MAMQAEGGLAQPIARYRVRSWCHQWLSVDSDESWRVRFSSREDHSCRILLRPSANGLYFLQVLSDELGRRTNDLTSALQVSEMCNVQDNTHCAQAADGKNSGGSEFSQSEPKQWFLCHRENCITVTDTAVDDQDLLFLLEFDEHGRVRIRGGFNSGYLTADARGRLWCGTQRPQKWEHFTLIEEAFEDMALNPKWIICAPVRVTLLAHTGKYLCGASPVLSARAEAACCCEEFLLDLKFPTLLSVKSFRIRHDYGPQANSIRRSSGNVDFKEVQPEEQGKVKCPHTSKDEKKSDGSLCTIRTADGKRMLSAEPDGTLFTTAVDHVRGMEKFEIKLHFHKSCPTVTIRPFSSEAGKRRTNEHNISVTSSGAMLCSRSEKKRWEAFGLSLANGSRVLIRSIHGGFLVHDPAAYVRFTHSEGWLGGMSEEHNVQKGLCTCLPCTPEKMRELGAWQLRSHGDSLYTMVAMPVAKGGAQVYLSVDSIGRILQSGAPAVHFPAAASLFEVVPVSGACLDTMDENICSFSGIVGFTIRTVRRIHGKQRYVSVEPSGKVFATRTRPSRWEIFQFIDVDAAAAAAAPHEFSCLPAAVNLNSSAAFNPSLQRDQLRMPSLGGNGGWGLLRRVALVPPLMGVDGVRGVSSITDFQSNTAGEDFMRACGVTAEAVSKGLAVPKRSPATLQELCIGHVCWFASAGSGTYEEPSEPTFKASQWPVAIDIMTDMHLSSIFHPELLELVNILKASAQGTGIPVELVDGNVFNIPDDLLSRIWTHWRCRQPSQQLCKWWPSSLLAQLPSEYLSEVRPLQNHLGRIPGHPFLGQGLPPQHIAVAGSNGEGWHCASCDTGGVLPMDPAVNPAHHKYLEVQYRAYSGARQPTALWSAVSFAGVSLMTTALAIRVVSFCRLSITIGGT